MSIDSADFLWLPAENSSISFLEMPLRPASFSVVKPMLYAVDILYFAYSGLRRSFIFGLRFGLLAIGICVICSIPPAMVTSDFPVIISMAPMAIAFNEDEHARSRDMDGTLKGNPARKTG